MRPSQHARPFRTALLAVAVGVLLVGCGADDSSSTATDTAPSPSTSSPSASAVPDGCADVAALKSSMQTLSEIRPLQDGLEATQAAVAEAKASLDAAVAAIGEELKPAVDDITTAFGEVQTAVAALTKDNVRDQAPVILTALQGLGTAVTSLGTAVSQECPA